VSVDVLWSAPILRSSPAETPAHLSQHFRPLAHRLLDGAERLQLYLDNQYGEAVNFILALADRHRNISVRGISPMRIYGCARDIARMKMDQVFAPALKSTCVFRAMRSASARSSPCHLAQRPCIRDVKIT
jgi:hypothetical protein